MVEILAPAGDPAKLATALRFGADAVYLGLRQLSLRSFAGNFTLDELEWALRHAHELGRRIYVAVNIQAFDSDLSLVEATLRQLARLTPDGLIIADPGVLALARSHAPKVPIHLSTQTSLTNAAAARFWHEQGVGRVCVARELSLEQLAVLVPAAAPVEIEAFVHGAVCVAWSGRCFLSLYGAGAHRDPRRGSCAQACRWPYRLIEDRRRPGEPNLVEADERGTYFFDARDLCALPVLERLLATGVSALKIEGRTRSEHYVGTVVDVYRDAVDRLAAGDLEGFRARRETYQAELTRPTNRGFSTHFLEGGPGGQWPGMDAYNPRGSRLASENDFVGRVVRAAQEDWIDVALRNPVRAGARIEVRSPGLVLEATEVREVRAEDGALLELGRPPHTVRLLTTATRVEAGAGALVRFPMGK